jgi:methylglutaconyl-CoA hydratase
MSSPSVRWSVDGRGVATVTLERPERNNAYDGAMIEGLLAALDALGTAARLRVVVLRGAGRHFQAGVDLDWSARVAEADEAENLRWSRLTAAAVHRWNLLPVPTLALVQGACVGGGTGFVAACDVVVAAEDAFFSIAETRWGFVASIIVPQLADAVGVRQLRRYALSGERFDAREACRLGLVHEVVPAPELDAAGTRVVDALLRCAPEATAQTKALLLAHGAGDLGPAALERLVVQHAARRRSAEAREGRASFQERRPAAWYPGSPA